MTAQSTNLQDLRDMAIPEVPPMWPPAPGVWVLLVVLLCLLALGILVWRRSRARNAYRRAGLGLLENAGTVRSVNVVLKRVAMAAFSRKRVASLYGESWATFLQETCPGKDFHLLTMAEPDAASTAEHRGLARTWIQKHRTQGVAS